MKLFHVTSEKKAKYYRQTGHIIAPVRGFNTPLAALAWAVRTGRKVIYEIDLDNFPIHLLPDHHNRFGKAFWTSENVPVAKLKCFFSGGKKWTATKA